MKERKKRRPLSCATLAKIAAAAKRKRLLMRCVECTLLASALKEGFVCSLTRCPKKVQVCAPSLGGTSSQSV
jgi:hypothetical protein